jgi:hypothetical protein
MTARVSRRLSNSRAASGYPENLLQFIQVPAAILDSPATIISLNQSAVELTGFSERDFSRQPSLWGSRIVAEDKAAFVQHQENIRRRDLQTTCDYRFVPNRHAAPIWLREMTIPLAGLDRPYWMSTYLKLGEKDVKQPVATKVTAAEARRELLERCFHDIKNRLHLLNMELELASLESAENFDAAKMANVLQAINDSIKVLQQLLLPGSGRALRS